MRVLLATAILLLAAEPAFLAAATHGPAPHPIPPGPNGAPNEISHAAILDRLAEGPLFVEQEGGGSHFVKDQMMAVLLFLARADRLPEDAAALRDSARAVWDVAEAAFVSSADYYSVTLASQSVCADLLANAWALRATRALATVDATGAYASRADALRTTLSDLFANGRHAGVGVCPPGAAEPPVRQQPLALLALLEEYAKKPDAGLAGLIRSVLDELATLHYAKAYREETGLFAAATNAQMLLVLDLADDLLPDTSLATQRTEVVAFLVKDSIGRDATGTWALGVLPSANASRTRVGGPEAPAQWWAAYALHNHALASPDEVPAGLVDELADSVLARFWSYERRGFVSDDGRVHFEPNALAALLFDGAVLSGAAPEDPEVRLVVPKRAAFAYPGPAAADAGKYYVRNKWDVRFTVVATSPGPQHVLLPTHAFGALNASLSISSYAPALSVFAGTQRLPSRTLGSTSPLVDFTANLGAGPNGFRLGAYVPVLPSEANVTDTVRLVLRSYADAPIRVSSLYLEVEATNVNLESVHVNDVALAPTDVALEEPLTTAALPEPHVGISMRGVTLRPFADNEILIRVHDVESPAVGEPSLSHDAQGADLVRPQEGEYEIVTGELTYVRLPVRDNFALRSVYVNAVPEGTSNATQARLDPDPTTPGFYVGVLPRFSETGTYAVTVVAEDTHNNQASSATPLTVVVRNAFLGGDLIAFAFSATLLIAALAIFVKMGRKKERAGR